MTEEKKTLLLLSSNIRRRYAEDILSALALPAGAVLQFRYDDGYVASEVDRDVEKNTVTNVEALLGFIADVDTDHPFVVPVRYATVVSAERFANFYIFRLRIGQYVDLSQYPWKAEAISQFAMTFLDGLRSANKKYYPAVYSAPDLRVRRSSNDADDWRRTAARLALHSTFADSYFVRVDTPLTQKGTALAFNDDGRLQVVDQQSVRVSATFYCERYNADAKPMLTCATDGTFLRVSSDSEYAVALRYDTVEFWLHPAALNFETLSRMTIGLHSPTDDATLVPAYARFQVVVRRSRSQLLFRLVITSIGALLVALPAILGPSAPLELRVVCAVVGAAMLAVAAVVLNSSR